MILVNNREKIEYRDGITVQDILSAMGWDYALIMVKVNGVFVPKEDYSSTAVPDEADVKAIHIAHGG